MINRVDFFYDNGCVLSANLSEDDTTEWAREYVHKRFNDDANIQYAEVRLNGEYLLMLNE